MVSFILTTFRGLTGQSHGHCGLPTCFAVCSFFYLNNGHKLMNTTDLERVIVVAAAWRLPVLAGEERPGTRDARSRIVITRYPGAKLIVSE